MKNWARFSLTFVLLLTLIIGSTPGKVSAKILSPVETGVAPGAWEWSSGVAGSEIPMSSFSTPARSWTLLLANGLKLDAPAKICHPFRGGQFGWTSEIYMLIGNSWIKLPTIVDWVPTIEGKLMACAQAPSAGTYALFGYYSKPAGSDAIPECADFDVTPFFNDDGNGTISDMGARILPAPKAGTLVEYQIFDVFPVNKLSGALSGFGTTADDGTVSVPGIITYTGEWSWSATLSIETMGCYYEFYVQNGGNQ